MKTRHILRGLTSAALCGLLPPSAWCQTSGPSSGGPEVILRVAGGFPLNDAGSGLLLPVTIGDLHALPMLLDTGSNAHFVDAAHAPRLGPRKAALMSATPAGERLCAVHTFPPGSRSGPMVLDGQDACLLEKGGLPWPSSPRPAGTLGLEALRGHFWTFDFDEGRLTLTEIPAGPASAPVPRGALIQMPAALPDGSTLPFLLDTGCLAFGTLEAGLFDRLAAASLLTGLEDAAVSTSASPESRTRRGCLEGFTFQGKLQPHAVFLRSDGNRLGWDFFVRWNWQLCLERGWVSPLPRSRKPTPPAVPSPHKTGGDVYQRACAGCHMSDGRGQPGLFPPLRGSDWVSAPDPARLIRIVLHGMMGPLTINGKPFTSTAPFMPGQGVGLTDDEVAQALTWVRKEFAGLNAPVEPAAVAAVRLLEKDRTAMWTQSRLLAIPLKPPTPP